MKSFFDSKNIAVIGASKNPQKLGYQLLKNLLDAGFEGRIYPINLDEDQILNLKTYRSVLDVHAKIDLAVIIVPREVVPSVLLQCVHKEIGYALIISAGFAEKDKKGQKLQKKLLQITKHSKTKIIGPNCLGIVDTFGKLNLTFAASQVISGSISLILQSGAIGAAIFDWAKENNIGINKFISLGNKVHIDELDALEILGNDEKTKVIGLYLEEISHPKEFLIKCRQITAKKPVIILKGGLTLQGSKAALTHTAALNSPEELNEALFKQAKLLVAKDYEELINLFEFLQERIFNLKNNNLAIVTNAGGPSILAVDTANRNGLNVKPLNNKDKKFLKKELINFASLNNPIDLGGDATANNYLKTINFFARHNDFSAIVVIITPQSMTDIEAIAKTFGHLKNNGKPIVGSFLGGARIKKAIEILRKYHIPFYDDPSEAVEQIAKVYHFSKSLKINPAPINIRKDFQFHDLSDEDLVRHYQFPFVKSFIVENDADVMGHLENLGYPIVYKSFKEKLRGKAAKIGLNINDHETLKRSIHAIGFPGILQKMVDSPFEVIIGAKRDPQFGIILIFGAGGIFVEEIEDINRKMLPLTDRDLDEMIEETKIWQAIKEFNVKSKIKNIIIAMAKLMLENSDIREVELNPLKITQNNIVAVDVNIKREK